MKAVIYDNYHAGISMLPEEEQDAFYGAVMRYVFEGREPEFDGVQAIIWATIGPLIDKSTTGQKNGAKGGDGRGNRRVQKPKDETQSEKTSDKPKTKTKQQNPPAKPTCKTPSENQIKRNKGNEKDIPKEYLFNSPTAGAGADAGEPAPRTSGWVCPRCGSTAYPDGNGWRCPKHGSIPAADPAPTLDATECPASVMEAVRAARVP